MIPRILHRVWLGDNPIPDEFEAYWAKWAELHPNWELRTWGDEHISWLKNKKLLAGLPSFSSQSDLVRFEVLQQFGGVYVDTDVEPMRCIDPLLKASRATAFAGWESDQAICTAVMGAVPGHPAVQALVDGFDMRLKTHGRRQETIMTGPGFLTDTWRGRSDVTIFEPSVFYPVHWRDIQLVGVEFPKTSYAAHHWARSWDTAPSSAILVPYRPDGGQRDQIWEWMKPRWERHFSGSPIVMGTDSGSGLFNRAQAVNDAARKVSADVYIVADSDVWVDPRRVQGAVVGVTDYRMPWVESWKINQRTTTDLLKRKPLEVQLTQERLKNAIEWKGAGYFGGLAVINAEAFEAVGGMDERFQGWGFEDTALVYAMDELAGRRNFNGEREPGLLVHFWHPKQDRAETGTPSPESQSVFNEYRQRRGLKEWTSEREQLEFSKGVRK